MKLLPLVLNLFTGVGGHFYNHRIDRVVLIIAITTLMIVFYSLGNFFLSMAFIESDENFPINSAFDMYRAFAVGLVGILIYSAYLAYIDQKTEVTTPPQSTVGLKFSAAILSLVGAVIVFYQIYASSYFFMNIGVATKVSSSDKKVEGRRFSSFSSDRFFWNGFSLKRYDRVFSDTSLPEPPKGKAFLTGQFVLASQPVKDLEFDMVINGMYRAKRVKTNTEGKFSVPIKEGRWNVEYIHAQSWPGKPEGKQFIILTGREDVLDGNKYREHKYMDYEQGLPVEVNQEGQSTPLLFKIAEQFSLVQPSTDREKARKETYNIKWKPFKDAADYLIEVSEITREGTTTRYTPVTNIRVANVTELPLNQLDTVPSDNEPTEYQVKVYAFDLEGNFLSKSDSHMDKNTFILLGGNKIVSDRFRPGFAESELGSKEIEQLIKNEKRIKATSLLIEDGLYMEAENLLNKVVGKSKKGAKDAVTGYLFASQNQCEKAKIFFDKALSEGGKSCIPRRYRKNCLNTH